MPFFIDKIESILGGQSPSHYFGDGTQFLTSRAIDPDFAADGGDSMVKTGGVITPAPYAKFSGALLSGAPQWIVTNPKDSNIYVYASDGEFLSYNSSFGSESVVGTPTSGAGNGMAYYNNYIYLFTPTDVSRYGPLDGTPALTNNVWTGSTLGSQTALTNTTYPSVGNVSYPNHAPHLHTDGKLYFCDFINGQGLIHYIKTSKTTNEGDTNDSSTYNALDLPFGYMPTDIETWGRFLVISAIQTTDSTLKQGNSSLFFWDTTSSSFQRPVVVEDTLISALKSAHGVIYVFHGNMVNGYGISVYNGGSSVIPLEYFEEGYTPFPGAVEAYGSRLFWGSSVTSPASKACVFSRGYSSPKLPRTAVNNIATATAGTTTPIVSAVKMVQQASGILPRVILGWRDSEVTPAYGIDKLDTTGTQDSIIRTAVRNIGEPFKITKLKLNLSGAVGANNIITVKIFYDDEADSETLTTINNTNYSGKRNITFSPTKSGKHNYFYEISFTGTDIISVLLPITTLIETLDD